MKTIIGVSNRHIHISKEDYDILFGNMFMENINDLVQPGEFASNLVVKLKTEKNIIENVRVIGPIRTYTQVEISKTDSYLLGINPPIRTSGDLNGAANITIIGPLGEVTKGCCIIANRHLHINKDVRKQLCLDNVEKVKVKVGNEKSAILYDVFIKETLNGALELHLDTDDANGNFIITGDTAEIIPE